MDNEIVVSFWRNEVKLTNLFYDTGSSFDNFWNSLTFYVWMTFTFFAKAYKRCFSVIRCSDYIYLTLFLIFLSHLRLGLPSILLLSVMSTQMLMFVSRFSQS